jgi:hypothetical protein
VVLHRNTERREEEIQRSGRGSKGWSHTAGTAGCHQCGPAQPNKQN